MFELTIHFESSWSNSFRKSPGGEPLFTSGSELTKSMKGVKPVPFDKSAVLKSGSRLDYLRAFQEENPTCLYRVPKNYDSTMQGVLARLVGEVRHMTAVEQDHLALRAFASGTYDVQLSHEHSQTTTLTSFKPNAVASGGVGIVSNEVLYSASAESQYLFGHLGLSLVELKQNLAELLAGGSQCARLTWTPRSPTALVERLGQLMEEQKSILAVARKNAKNDKTTYLCPEAEVYKVLADAFPLDALATLEKQNQKATDGDINFGPTIEAGGLEGWNIAGAIIVQRVRQLSPDRLAEFIRVEALTAKGKLSGLTMSGSLGFVSAKDLFGYASGSKAMS